MTTASEKIELHVTCSESDVSAVDVLSERTGLSKQRIKRAMHNGSVWLTRKTQTSRLRRVSRSLETGDELHLYYDYSIQSEEPIPCKLLSDEGDYSVWYKPFGARSQGSKWGDHCTVYRWAELNLTLQRPTFTVHRLDRAAAGMMLVAHSKGSAAQLAALFKRREIEKRYQAIVHGCLTLEEPECLIETPIDGREAISHVSVVATDPLSERSLLAVRTETGRKHQIRKHLSEMGYPIVGDRMYGRKGDEEDLCLRAVSLAFTCPISTQSRLYILEEPFLLSFP